MGNITVSNIGKAYKQYPTRWSRLLEWISQGHKVHHTLRWVLKSVSFSVASGESVGIVGVNGAGKSTLLKMITGTTQPTEGVVSVHGRVAALLELGMGFHSDFSGRQNVYMAGQIQGLSINELSDLMPQIERFAEIGDYLDQPVRVYSSGMQVRLAFAVATAKRPDVLIVDEALAVGDLAFQRKCYRRIEEFTAKGTTLLVVTHDTETVRKICKKALWIGDGRLQQYGSAKEVCDLYERMLFGGDAKNAQKELDHPKIDDSLREVSEVAYGDGRAVIESVAMEIDGGVGANVFRTGCRFCVRYRVRAFDVLVRPVFAMMIKNREGMAVFGTDSIYLKHDTGIVDPGTVVFVDFELENNLAPGVYYLNCGVRDERSESVPFIHRRVDAKVFKVVGGGASTAAAGIVDLKANINVLRA